MRLNSLLLGKFGHFIEREIRFDANAKLHIVLGPNEAGKSTLRKSWLRLLFSYDLRKGNEPEAFGFRNEDLSVSATIGYGEDQEVAVSRRWKALRDAEGAKLSDNDFLTLISSPNEQLVRQLFALDQSELRDGGEALINDSEGGLFAAATGKVGLTAVIADLKKRQEILFLPRGKKTLNKKLTEISKLQSEIKGAALKESTWLALTNELSQAQERQTQLFGRAKGLREQLIVLHRRRDNFNDVQRLRKVRLNLLDFEGFPQLSPTQISALAANLEKQRELEQTLRPLEPLMTGIETEMSSLPGGETSFDQQAHRLDNLSNQIGAVLKAESDLPKLNAAVAQQQEQATALLQQCGLSGDIQEVVSLLPSDVEVSALRHLEREQASNRSDIRELDNQSLVIKEGAQRLQAEESRLERERNSLGFQAVKLSALPSLVWPTTAEMSSAHEALERHKAVKDDVEREKSGFEKRLIAVELKEDELTGGDEASSLRDLTALRTQRDSLLQQEVLDKSQIGSVLDQLDSVTDNLLSQAEARGELEGLRQEKRRINRELSLVIEKNAKVGRELRSAWLQWEELCVSYGLPTKPPRAMNELGKSCHRLNEEVERWLETGALQNSKESSVAARRVSLIEEQKKLERLWQEVREKPLFEKFQSLQEAIAFCEFVPRVRSTYEALQRDLHRIESIKQDRIQFDQAIADLYALLEISHDNTRDSVDLAQELHDQRDLARQINDKRKLLNQQLNDTRKKADVYRAELKDLQLTLDATFQALDVALPKDPEDWLLQIREKAALHDSAKDTETAIELRSPAISLEVAIEEVEEAELAELQLLIEQTQTEVEHASTAVNDFAQEVGRLEQQIASSSNSTQVSDLRQELEFELSEAAELTRQFKRISVTRALLMEALKRFQQENRTPLMTRAIDYFSQLTAGRYNNLFLSGEEGDVIFCEGPNKRSRRLEDLSEGTADQLYLALRFARLKELSENEISSPFIGDDLLVNFDDERSEAAFATMAGLSSRCQMIYLTHHPHMVDLARNAVGREAVQVIELA